MFGLRVCKGKHCGNMTHDESAFSAGQTTCKFCQSVEHEKWYSTLVHETLTAYGGESPCCECCGEDHPKMLTIDHLNNDGNKQRNLFGYNGKSVFVFLRKLNYPRGYAVMCYNCNCGRGRNGGVCPKRGAHQKLKAASLKKRAGG